jgi:hypothetical protein
MKDLQKRLASLVLAIPLLAAGPGQGKSGPDSQPAPVDERPIDLTRSALDLDAARSHEFREIAGRKALCLEGVALLKGELLSEGAILVDVASAGERQFAGVVFRADDAANFEEAYLRTHKSRQPDAIQYTPVMNGETNWQLFRQFQAMADFGDQPWVTLRVDFRTDSALVSAYGASETQLRVDRLVQGGEGQRLGLNSLGGACFSNLRLSRQPRLPAIAPAAPTPVPAGTITSWALSPVTPFGAFAPLPPEPGPDWNVVKAEDDGVLLISRHRSKAVSALYERNPIDVVHAGVSLRSESQRTVELEFDASDRSRIYLNGRALAEFDNTFRAKGPLFRGDFGMAQQKLFVPLEKGTNSLVFAVAERANGWGLSARLVDPAGIEVSPLGQ